MTLPPAEGGASSSRSVPGGPGIRRNATSFAPATVTGSTFVARLAGAVHTFRSHGMSGATSLAPATITGSMRRDTTPLVMR